VLPKNLEDQLKSQLNESWTEYQNAHKPASEVLPGGDSEPEPEQPEVDPALEQTMVLLDKHSIVVQGEMWNDSMEMGQLAIDPNLAKKIGDDTSDGTKWSKIQAYSLFNGMPSPKDIKQGNVGDCYIMTAIGAILARDPGIIVDSMKELDDKTVIVRLWHWDDVNGRAVPDYYRVNKTCSTTKGALRSQPWVLILEKAFIAHAAKYHPKEKNGGLSEEIDKINNSSYDKYIEGGSAHTLMFDILGSQSNDHQTVFMGSETERKKAVFMSGTNKVRQPGDYTDYALRVFQGMKDKFDQNIAMSCGVSGAGDDSKIVYANIHKNHAYAILDVKKATTRSGKNLCLVKIRNPWGYEIPHYVERNGEWVLESNTAAQDGVCTMDLNDFLHIFARYGYCKLS